MQRRITNINCTGWIWYKMWVTPFSQVISATNKFLQFRIITLACTVMKAQYMNIMCFKVSDQFFGWSKFYTTWFTLKNACCKRNKVSCCRYSNSFLMTKPKHPLLQYKSDTCFWAQISLVPLLGRRVPLRSVYQCKLSRTSGIFFNVWHYCPLPILICLYKSLFSSFLNYGIAAWGLAFKSYLL